MGPRRGRDALRGPHPDGDARRADAGADPDRQRSAGRGIRRIFAVPARRARPESAGISDWSDTDRAGVDLLAIGIDRRPTTIIRIHTRSYDTIAAPLSGGRKNRRIALAFADRRDKDWEV